jgi:hypothetical protein
MTLSQYFAKPDTPSANSPMGTIMVKVLEKYPGITFEDARAKAHCLILESAGKKRFNLPRVLSEAELAEQKERLKTAWKPRIVPNAGVSSTTSNAIPS